MMRSIGNYNLHINQFTAAGAGAFNNNISKNIKYAVSKQTNVAVVIKCFDKAMLRQRNLSDKFKKDMMSLKALNHPYVVQIKDIFANTSKIFVVMEWMDGGSLQQLLDATGMFTEPRTRYYYRQLVDALQFCHSHGYCYGDLNPTDILFDSNCNLKLPVARIFSDAENKFTPANMEDRQAHVLPYLAPELLRRGMLHASSPNASSASRKSESFFSMESPSMPSSPSSPSLGNQQLNDKVHTSDSVDSTSQSPFVVEASADVWSIGVILYQLLLGAVPFMGMTVSGQYLACINRLDAERINSSVSESAAELLRSLMVVELSARWSLSRVWESAWLQETLVEVPSTPTHQKLVLDNSMAFRDIHGSATRAPTSAPSSPSESDNVSVGSRSSSRAMVSGRAERTSSHGKQDDGTIHRVVHPGLQLDFTNLNAHEEFRDWRGAGTPKEMSSLESPHNYSPFESPENSIRGGSSRGSSGGRSFGGLNDSGMDSGRGSSGGRSFGGFNDSGMDSERGNSRGSYRMDSYSGNGIAAASSPLAKHPQQLLYGAGSEGSNSARGALSLPPSGRGAPTPRAQAPPADWHALPPDPTVVKGSPGVAVVPNSSSSSVGSSEVPNPRPPPPSYEFALSRSLSARNYGQETTPQTAQPQTAANDGTTLEPASATNVTQSQSTPDPHFIDHNPRHISETTEFVGRQTLLSRKPSKVATVTADPSIVRVAHIRLITNKDLDLLPQLVMASDSSDETINTKASSSKKKNKSSCTIS